MTRHQYRSKRVTSFTSFALLGLVVLTTNTLNAAPIVHGNFPGLTVDYLGVQEESVTDPAQGAFPGPGLFGAPTVAGDAMDFNPQAFAAFSSGGGVPDTTDSNLQFMVKAHPNKSINVISFAEAGDTNLTGLSGEAQTTVGAIINAEIQELNIGGVLTPVSINLPQLVMGFAPQSSWLRTVDGVGSKGWTGSAVLNLLPYGVVTKLGISLDNTLSAASEATTSAFIQKKDADALVITVSTGEIPEPGTLVMAMIAAVLGSAAVFGRRK